MPQFFSQIYSLLGGTYSCDPQTAPYNPTWQPLVDIYACCDDIVIMVELPGVAKEDIEVEVERGILKITGIRHKRIPDDTRHVHQMEIPYGHFARYVRLPDTAQPGEISADFEHGFLRILIPTAQKKMK